MENDCYRLLGISPDADEPAIRRAFRLKTKEIHPDVNTSADATSEFIALRQAHDLLLDPVKRLQHDRHFGYAITVPNQDANAKQKFSVYQETKAQELVKDWSADYEKAMRMREAQRHEAIRLTKRRIVLLWIALGIIVALIVVIVLLFLSWHPTENLPQVG